MKAEGEKVKYFLPVKISSSTHSVFIEHAIYDQCSVLIVYIIIIGHSCQTADS